MQYVSEHDAALLAGVAGGEYQQAVDPSFVRPLPPRCHTFRLSEIEIKMTKYDLSSFLDCLRVGNTEIPGNSRILSLASDDDRRFRVATVAFHQEPNEFKECKPGKPCYLQDPDRDIKRTFRLSSIMSTIIVDCDFDGMTPLYISPCTSVQYE
jgi:hypothetical protein